MRSCCRARFSASRLIDGGGTANATDLHNAFTGTWIPVGTFSGNPPVIQTGYNKQYTYDTRLKYLSPPYFLSPTLSAWQRISYSEIIPTATP